MTDLLSRLSALTGPSRELDAEIALANGWVYRDNYGWRSPTGQVCPQPPRYTESIDVVVRDLVPEGIMWDVGRYKDRYYAKVWKPHPIEAFAATPAIALTIACQKARNDEGLPTAEDVRGILRKDSNP